MKVKMLTMSAGASGAIRAGDVVDVSAHEAKLLIAGRFAEVVELPKVEKPKQVKK